MAIINVIILNARYFWLYIRAEKNTPSTVKITINFLRLYLHCSYHLLACFFFLVLILCVVFFFFVRSLWRSATPAKLLLHFMNCMFHPRLRKAFKSLMFTLSHTRSYMVCAHFIVYTQIFGVFRVCVLYSTDWQRDPFAAWVDMELHGAHSGAHLKRPIRSPNMCAWCWGILEWHSLTIYACIQWTHTINWSSILWTCNFAFIASGALVFLYIYRYISSLWLDFGHRIGLPRSSIIRRSGMTSEIYTRFTEWLAICAAVSSRRCSRLHDDDNTLIIMTNIALKRNILQAQAAFSVRRLRSTLTCALMKMCHNDYVHLSTLARSLHSSCSARKAPTFPTSNFH